MRPARSSVRGIAMWGGLALAILVLVQACGESGRSTGPSGNSQVSVALRRTSGLLPAGCSGTITAKGPITTSGPIGPDGQVTLVLSPGTYVFTANIVCNGQAFEGTSAPTQINAGPNNVTIEVFVAPSGVGAFCSPSSLSPGGTTQCTCSGTLVSGATPTFSWSAPGADPGSASGAKASFKFPNPGNFTLTCTVTNGPQSRSVPVTVQVTANVRTLTVTINLGQGASGSVASNPAGISCPGTCVATFTDGVSVILTATPTGGSGFGGFSGDCTGASPCAIPNMNGGKTVAAAFTSPPPTTGNLVVTNSATGTCCDLFGGVTFSGPAPIQAVPALAPGSSATRNGLVPGNYTANWCMGPTPFTISAGQTTQLNLDGNSCG